MTSEEEAIYWLLCYKLVVLADVPLDSRHSMVIADEIQRVGIGMLPFGQGWETPKLELLCGSPCYI